MDLEGSIVEFIDSGALRLGYVRKREHRKLQIVDPRGRQSSVPLSKLVVVHDCIPEEDFPQAAARILERISVLESGIDSALLWGSIQSERREFSASELATVYFGNTSPEAESAIYRRLSRDALFFRRSGSGFETRSGEQVAAEKLRLERQEEHERERRETTRILGLALRESTAPEDMTREEAWPAVLERMERWLRRNECDDIGEALGKVAGEAASREAAYELLVRYGRIPPTEDRFLLVRGIPTAFSREVLELADRLGADVDTKNRTLYSGRTFSIDDAYTVEIDDALTVTRDGDETRVAIHIADVASFVDRGDPLDREAHRRSSTIYLPNVSVMMFPPRLATDLASLVEGRQRPALTVEARFSADNRLLDFRFFRSAIRVTDRMEYTEADRAVGEGDPELTRLGELASFLSDERVLRGGWTHRRPDVKVHVDDGRILVQRLEADTPARLIVSEMMILANRLAATHAALEGFPVIFRTQEPPEGSRPSIEGLHEAMQFELLRRTFKRSRLSLEPSPHAGLGLPCYTQMSSPIRRYADLVTQRQFTAALAGQPLPYARDELLEIMTSLEANEIEIRRLEQTSTAWWVLTYLARECLGVPLEATVVDRKGTVEISRFLVRARLADHGDLEPGDAVTIQIDSVDPDHGAIRVRPGA
jgi:exoribonuclease-2